jgi:hypothetical protein
VCPGAHRYRFHLELPKGGYRFLLAARKRIKSATSTYVISTSADDLSRHSRHCVAKLRSNLLGTAFTVVTSGGGSNCSSTGSSRPASGVAGARPATQPHQQQLAVSRAGVAVPQQQQQQQQQQQHLARQRSSGGTAVGQRSGRERDGSNAWQQQQQPGDAPAASAAHGGAKCELGAVLYETNVLGTRGPRRMSAAVPAADASGASLWLPAAGAAQDSIADRLRCVCVCVCVCVWLCARHITPDSRPVTVAAPPTLVYTRARPLPRVSALPCVRAL